MKDFCGSVFWDSELFWADKNPDLTICFKQIVFTWVPCFILWIFAPLDFLRRLNSRYSNIPLSLLFISKLFFTNILILQSIVNFSLIIILMDYEDIYYLQLTTEGIKSVTFIIVALLLYVHKKKGHHSSGLLFNFWLMLSFFAIPELRFIINSSSDSLLEGWLFKNFYIYFCLISIMLILTCLNDKFPTNSTYPKSSNPSPELFVGILSKISYHWWTKTAWLGFMRPLNEKDLYESNPENTCSELFPPFEKNFKKSIEKNKKKFDTLPKDSTIVTNGSSFISIIKAYGGPFWFSAIFRILCDGLLISMPLLLHKLMTFIDDGGSTWKGYFLVAMLFLVAFIQSFLNAQYYQNNLTVGHRMRTGLMAAIYRKSLKIASSVKKDTTVGEIVNLMAVDANRFFELMPNLHIMWSSLMIIGVVTYLLYGYIGYAVFTGLLFTILTFPLSIWIATKLKTLQIQQMKLKDERIKSMNEIIGGMKVLKLYAWEPSFEKLILNIRKTEMKFIRKTAIYNALIYFLWSLAPFIIAMTSFITYVYLGGTLTPQKAFVSIALFNLFRFPMTMFPMLLNFLMQSLVAAKRIDKFLNSKELDPNNVSRMPCEKAMYIKNGTFSWEGSLDVLKEINIAVKKGSLVAVVGPVGSGKSSLISAFLGEMHKLNGNVNIDGRIGYVPQQAWIQNATLQNNILFGKPLNKRLYERVINACALIPDFAMLPGGDQTEIGEKGINLSGGQKQRVSLARAVYNDAEIYIFDDPLSAVDAHVGKHIFENVLSETGLLRGKTRFLVTNALAYLPKVDEIYVMLDGKITETGTYKELIEKNGAFAELLAQYFQEEAHQKDLHQLNEEDALNDETLLRRRGQSHSSSMNSNRSSEAADLEKNEKSIIGKLIETEEVGMGSVSVKQYVQYFKYVGFWMTILTFGSNILFQASAIGSNVWLALWSSSEHAQQDSTRNTYYASIYGGIGFSQAITLILASILIAIGCLNVAKISHNKLLHNIIRLPMCFFDTTPLGRILNRFSRDMDIVDNIIPIFMRNLLFIGFAILGIFIVISVATPWFLVAMVPIILIYYFVQKFYIGTSRQIRRLESLTRSPVLAYFSETISGQSVIRAYAEQKRFVSESDSKIDFHQGIAYQGFMAHRWLSLRVEIIGAFIIFFAGLFAVLARDTISSATVGLSVSYALQISQLLFLLIRMAVEVETNIIAIERIDEYATKDQEAPWKKGETSQDWPQNGVVEFKDLKVKYREGLDNVLKGISFTINSEEKIGIVGRTGAGKSSLTLALFRIIEAAGGKIVIDDIDISEIGLHSLRSRLTIIPQDPVLFSGSLRMNIDPFNSYSDDAIWSALDHSHLKSFVKGLTDGLSHNIIEGGENLSVGQRQLVCLARALLRKTKVLILDEATAAIDFETDELIQKTIRTQFNDCTILTIAHRLNTIMDSDRIIVLDQGMIAEFDTPEALLANRNSIFYGMARNAGIIGNETN